MKQKIIYTLLLLIAFWAGIFMAARFGWKIITEERLAYEFLKVELGQNGLNEEAFWRLSLVASQVPNAPNSKTQIENRQGLVPPDLNADKVMYHLSESHLDSAVLELVDVSSQTVWIYFKKSQVGFDVIGRLKPVEANLVSVFKPFVFSVGLLGSGVILLLGIGVLVLDVLKKRKASKPAEK